MNADKYIQLKRLIAFISAIGLWAVSMYFSYKGFEFESTEVLWFGVVMALVVTTVELVFNTKITKLNPTLLLTGILCYMYGVYTNVTGFYVLQHGTLEGFFTQTQWLIPSFAGLVSEILPEALFAWGIGAYNDGDLVGNIGEMFATNTGNSNNKHQQNNQKRSYQPAYQGNNKQSKASSLEEFFKEHPEFGRKQ